MSNQQIQNDSDPKKYFIMLPNIADDSDLDPYEFRLYVHYARVGNCWEGTATTAKKCHMSMGAVSKKRRSLADKGWITLKEPEKDNPTDTIKIKITDKWAENMKAFTPSLSETPPSPDETPPSLSETPPSPDETPPSLSETKKNKEKKSAPPSLPEKQNAHSHYENKIGTMNLVMGQRITDAVKDYGKENVIMAIDTAQAKGAGFNYVMATLKGRAKDKQLSSKGDAVWEEIQERIRNGKWDGLTPTTLAVVRKCGGASVFKSASEQWDIPRLKKQVYTYAQ